MKISTNCVKIIEKSTGIKNIVYKKSTVNDFLFNRYSKQVKKFIVFFNNFIKSNEKENIFTCNFSTGELTGIALIPDCSNGISQKTTVSIVQWETLLLYIEKVFHSTDYEFQYNRVSYTIVIRKHGIASYGLKQSHTEGKINPENK